VPCTQNRIDQARCESSDWFSALAFALTVEKLHGSDPLDLVKEASAKLTRFFRDKKRFNHRVIFLDSDCLEKRPDRDATARRLAKENSFELIWQHPCHEAFLLRHFQKTARLRPSTTADAIKQLEKIWPSYYKGMDAFGYGNMLGIENVMIARGELPEFDNFLTKIGWP
jgi:hypothetical protein